MKVKDTKKHIIIKGFSRTSSLINFINTIPPYYELQDIKIVVEKYDTYKYAILINNVPVEVNPDRLEEYGTPITIEKAIETGNVNTQNNIFENYTLGELKRLNEYLTQVINIKKDENNNENNPYIVNDMPEDYYLLGPGLHTFSIGTNYCLSINYGYEIKAATNDQVVISNFLPVLIKKDDYRYIKSESECYRNFLPVIPDKNLLIGLDLQTNFTDLPLESLYKISDNVEELIYMKEQELIKKYRK